MHSIFKSKKGMARIDIIDHDQATGELKEIYDNLIKSRGKLANVHKIHSLHPKSLTAHMDFYMTLMFNKSPLKRYQREMLGVVTSKNNNCRYCVKHHAEALNFYWKDANKIQSILSDLSTADVSEQDKMLCDYAEILTQIPSSAKAALLIEQMKSTDLSHRAILDATLIIGYFNFVNRLVLGLAVEEEVETGGYNY